MDYYGLFPKFKINRPLNEQEIRQQLKQKVRVNLNVESLVPDNSVISINSSFLELVDKYYSSKGLLGLIGFVGFCGCLFMLLASVLLTIPSHGWVTWGDAGFIFVFAIITIPMGGWMLYLLKTEWFSWTHYPIRFDRVNKMVHVHRIDGSVYTVPWEKVFFTTGLNYSKDFNKDYYISGHVLGKDKKTIVDTFCLPATHSDQEQLKFHWEFVRRYMEEGPESVIEAVDFCLPIQYRRESYRFGFLYLLSQYNGAPIILFPIFFMLSLIFSIPRYVSIVTSKRPSWNSDVEILCSVDINDPNCRSSEDNSNKVGG